MTFKRKFIAPGELTDAEVQHVVTLATADPFLMEARKRVIETMAQVVNGKTERDDDLLDDLFGKLAVEIKRVTTTAYSRFGINDLHELVRQVMDLPVGDDPVAPNS